MTDADAERQLQRVDELAARLRMRAGLVFASVALACPASRSGRAAWLPRRAVEQSGVPCAADRDRDARHGLGGSCCALPGPATSQCSQLDSRKSKPASVCGAESWQVLASSQRSREAGLPSLARRQRARVAGRTDRTEGLGTGADPTD